MSVRIRHKSPLGIYHVMFRGVNRQIIFDSPKDYKKFIEILKVCKEKSNFALYAYCLMDNHVHLLIRESDVSISDIIKGICIRYVQYYNNKYGRVGHLFSDRFKSEAVYDERYFLNVLRYVLKNPVAAGIVSSPEDYEFSSCKDYYEDAAGYSRITDRMLAMELCPDLKGFLSEKSDEEFLDIDNSIKYTDKDVERFIRARFLVESVSEFQALSKEIQDEIIIKTVNEQLPKSSICRVLGITKGRIQYLSKMQKSARC